MNRDLRTKLRTKIKTEKNLDKKAILKRMLGDLYRFKFNVKIGGLFKKCWNILLPENKL